MCGIFFACQQLCNQTTGLSTSQLLKAFQSLIHRGPDNSQLVTVPCCSKLCQQATADAGAAGAAGADVKADTDKSKTGSTLVFGFHRLAIMDPLNKESNQPFFGGPTQTEIVLICNGEIYNYKELIQEYGLKCKTQSDCEVILHLYEKLGAEKTIQALVGEFAFVLYDNVKHQIFAGRDHVGVRRMQYAFSPEGSLLIASEPIAFLDIADPDYIFEWPPGHYATMDLNKLESATLAAKAATSSAVPVDALLAGGPASATLVDRPDLATKHLNFVHYTKHDWVYNHQLADLETRESCTKKLHDLLCEAVKKMMVADRPVGTLLSGGLDSSLITAIAVKINPKLHVFSIGLENSIDVQCAKQVAKHLGIPPERHHIYTFTVEEGIAAIPEVIKCLASPDITTIRASVPQYLMAKRIAKETDIKVILSGEGSDELFAGYRYSKDTTSAVALWDDAYRLLSELSRYDCLRSDGTISAHGLELRAPFLYRPLVKYVMSTMPREYRLYTSQGLGKSILRDAFLPRDSNSGAGDQDTKHFCDTEISSATATAATTASYLPLSILMRPKEAFSDAVSSKEVSWYKSLQLHVEKIFSASASVKRYELPRNLKPQTKEALYYRQVYEDIYGPLNVKVIPGYWMPRFQSSSFVEKQDPSATALSTF